MGAPITWQNVNAPSLAAAAVPMQYATSDLNAGFQKLGDILSQADKVSEQNWQQQKDNNTQAYLNALFQPKTPEELAASQAARQSLLSSFGSQVDQSQVRGAEDNRMQMVRNQVTAGQNYDTAQTERSQLPLVEQLKALAADGSDEAFKKAQDLMAAHPELLHAGDLVSTLTKGYRDNTAFDQANTKAEDAHAAAADNLLTNAVQRKTAMIAANAQAASAAAANGRLGIEQAQLKMQQDAAARGVAAATAQQALTAAMKNNVYADGTLAEAKPEDIMKVMSDAEVGTPSGRQAVLGQLAKLTDVNGTPVPLSYVKAAILGTRDHKWWTDNGWAEEVAKNVVNQMGNTITVPGADGNTQTVNRAQYDRQGLGAAFARNILNAGNGKK